MTDLSFHLQGMPTVSGTFEITEGRKSFDAVSLVPRWDVMLRAGIIVRYIVHSM